MTGSDQTVDSILDDLERAAKDADRVSIGDVIEVLGGRGFGPLLLVPALIEITPIGGIPGVPTFLAVIIILISVQMVFGRDHAWLPGFIDRRNVSGDRLAEAVRTLRPVGRRLDRWFHGRLRSFTGPGPRRIAAAISIVLCLTVPPLEFLPFASTAPMLAIAMFGLAMTLRDGRLMAAAFAASAVALGAALWLWPGW